MKKMTALQLYAAAVCFFSAAVLTIGGGSAVYSVVKIMSPDIAIRGKDFKAHQDNRAFVRWYAQRYNNAAHGYIPPTVLAELQEKGVLPHNNQVIQLPDNEEELTEWRKQSYANLLAASQHDTKTGLIETLIIVLLAALLFFIHWRMLKRLNHDSE